MSASNMRSAGNIQINVKDYVCPELGGSIKVVHKGCPVSSSPALQIKHTPKGLEFFCFACKARHAVYREQSYAELKAKQEQVKQAQQQEKQKADQRDWSLPADCSQHLPIDVLTWLAKIHFGPTLIKKHNLQYSPSLERLILPLPTGWQGKHFNYKEAKYYTHSPDKYMCVIGQVTEGPIVLVEDMYSAFRMEAIASYVVCLMGTPRKLPKGMYVHANSPILLWLDPDKAGRDSTRRLKRELQWYSLKVIDIQSLPDEGYSYYQQKDPKAYSDEDLKVLMERINEQ